MKNENINPKGDLIENLADYAKVWHNSEIRIIDSLKSIGNSLNSKFIGDLSSYYLDGVKIIMDRRYDMEKSIFDRLIKEDKA